MMRKAYPSDVSDDEWAFVAPYLTLMTEDAPQREHSLREVFNGLHYIARTGMQWRMMANDLPPWHAVYQQTQRWLKASVFEDMVRDLRMLMREIEGRTVRIAAGVNVVQRIHKATGRLIRASMEVKDNRLASVSLSGDFFCYPEGAIAQLESALEGISLEQVGPALSRFYADHEVETPGVTTDDWIKVLLG